MLLLGAHARNATDVVGDGDERRLREVLAAHLTAAIARIHLTKAAESRETSVWCPQ